MRYNIAAYDESYKAIVAEYGNELPGRIEAASNLVGLKWKNEGSYRITFERRNLIDGEMIKDNKVKQVSSPGELGLEIYKIILEYGLEVSLAKTRK